MEYYDEPEYLSWLINELKNTAYIFTFHKDEHVFGLVYELGNYRCPPQRRITHVNVKKMLNVIDDLAQNKPPNPEDRRLGWIFCNDALFALRDSKARTMILESIRSNLSPSVTSIIT
jgi:hypothetical protein